MTTGVPEAKDCRVTLCPDGCSEFLSGIIVNAVNEVMVEMFLKKKVPFLAINKFIFAIFKDSNYKKYAIKIPNSLSKIMLIDDWAKKTTFKLLDKL